MIPNDTADPLVVFVHIPKAGGMSITRLLKETYGDRLLIAHPLVGWPQRWSDETRALIAEKRHHFRAFAGHCAYGIHEVFGRPARYFTTVRHPLARMQSYYNFVRRWEIHHHHHKAKSLDIAQFFQRMADSGDIEFGNLQCLLIAGEKKFEAAKARIEEKFDFAVPVPRLSEALPVLAAAYGWPAVAEAPRENTTEHLSTLQRLPQNLLDQLVEANAEDQSLYDYCERKWSEQNASR